MWFLLFSKVGRHFFSICGSVADPHLQYYYAEFLVSTQLEFDFLRFQWLELVKEQIILF